MNWPLITRLISLLVRAHDWMKRNRWIGTRVSSRNRLAYFLMLVLIIVFLYFLFMVEQAYWLDSQLRTRCVPGLLP